MNALKVDELLFDKGEAELSRWLYQTYGERVFKGLDNELPAIKEYLNDNDIKLTDKKLAKLISVKDWNARQALKQAAQSLLRAVGTEVYMDYNIFYDLLSNAAKQQKLDIQAATLKAIARAMSEPDPDAAPVVKKEHKATSKEIEELTEVYGIERERLSDYGFYPVKKGMWVEYETDSDLRDTEKIPVKEDIYQYFLREVRPYVADAWINLPPTKIGCEISFNKYFYKPTPLRTLEENERDILELDRQSQGFKKTEPTYIPPFTVTDEITSLVADIAEVVGHLSATAAQLPTPQLRKKNRIKTIQSSLAIENNSMTIEQVTAIVDGKRVLGPPNEIQEVKNAIDAYELLFELDPFKAKDLLKAHKLMMADLVNENGKFRQGGVGVFDGERCVHLAPPAGRVPILIADLFDWVKTTKVHPLISSCVFHYEFEFIHPFADGNGRLGRMWQTLLLMRWKPIFVHHVYAPLPERSIGRDEQK